MDGREDRRQCEEGEERCDVCRQSNSMMEEAEALRQAYIAEQERSQQEARLDSGIDIPSSPLIGQASSAGAIQPSSPPIVRSRVVQPSSLGASSQAVQGPHNQAVRPLSIRVSSQAAQERSSQAAQERSSQAVQGPNN